MGLGRELLLVGRGEWVERGAISETGASGR